MQQMNIGERNGQFVLNYLKTEGIPVKAQDLGDVRARIITSARRPGHGAQDGAHQRAERSSPARTGRRAKRAKDRAPRRRFTRPGVELFKRPAARPGVERFDTAPNRPGVERFNTGAARPGVERFDTGITRRNKTETTG